MSLHLRRTSSTSTDSGCSTSLGTHHHIAPIRVGCDAYLDDGIRPHNDVTLATVKESPVLQREGYTQNAFEASGNPVPTMEEWTFAKQKWQRTKNVVRGDPKFETAQILPGWNEQVYV